MEQIAVKGSVMFCNVPPPSQLDSQQVVVGVIVVYKGVSVFFLAIV